MVTVARRRRLRVFDIDYVLSTPVSAQSGSVRGTVVDSQGGVVSGAGVKLFRDAAETAQTTTDARGDFAFESVPEGRYQVEVTAAGFDIRRTDPTFVGSPVLRIALQIGPLQQDVVVSASATEQSESEVGSSVTVINSETLEELGKTDVLEALRLVPGAQIVQAGARGGTTSLFIRGGNSDFNKVLMDGVAANDVGGGFDFAQLTTTGVERIEVLRTANSVLYGADALSGVVSIITKRGRSRIPDGMFSIDGGNLNTFRQAASIGGAVRRFDYFSEVSHLSTDNDVPNNDYRNTTYVGRFGVFAGTNTDISGTVRWTDTSYGSANAFNYYGIPDDAVAGQLVVVDDHLGSLANQQPGEDNGPVRIGRSEAELRGSGADRRAVRPVRVRAELSGQPGHDCRRERLHGERSGDYDVWRRHVSVGVGIERQAKPRERAARLSSDAVLRGVERRSLRTRDRRIHLRGSSRDHAQQRRGLRGRARNGSEPAECDRWRRYRTQRDFRQRSHAARVCGRLCRNRSGTSNVGDTKLTFNAGKGIKSPSLFEEQSSLFALIPLGSPLSGSVSPVGPERSRGFDAGVEQGFWRGRARARVAYFNNEFSNLLEFVNKNVLPQLGVPPEVANATQFGASVNSQSFDAQGVETAAEIATGRVRFGASYTFLDAEVTESLGGGALSPAFNPEFPDVPIGAFSPLIGARPFRRPAHSGTLMVSYTQGPAQVALAGHFVGKQDDSTFLTDEFFGNSLLLPNHNLDDSFQKVDLSGSYVFARRVRWYITLENLLNQDYEAAAGFPALPTTVRTGVTLQFGGGTTP